MSESTLKHIDAVLLCGGLGTRLQALVPDRQKVVANVGRQPFLGILLDKIFSEGIGRAVLCVGHLKSQVIEYVKSEKSHHTGWGEIVFSEETTPLGTGGAVKNAAPQIRSEIFFVMNGDTFSPVSLKTLFEFHVARKSFVTIAVARDPERHDVGSIRLGQENRIIGFHERAQERTNVVNAGTYCIDRAALGEMPHGVFSIEKEFFPQVVASHPCYAFTIEGDVLDIGTPERYGRANQLFS